MTPPTDRFTHEFVDFIPADLDDDVLYVSLPYTTVMHLCACGCGMKVASALDPTDYAITFDGETTGLDDVWGLSPRSATETFPADPTTSSDANKCAGCPP